MGWLADRLGRLVASRPANEIATATAPPPVDWRARGNAALARDDLAEAANCYAQGIAADPGDPVLRLNHGFVLIEQAQHRPAAERLEQALALRRPSDTFIHDAQYLLGRARVELGQLDAALVAYEAAAGSKPDFLEPVDELVRVLHRLQRHDQAAAWTRERSTRVAQTLAALDQLLGEQPGQLEAHVGKVTLLSEELRLDAAIAAARAGLQSHPEDPELHWLLAICHLLRGEFAAGWGEYEWRQSHAAFAHNVLQPPLPRWGGEDLQGRSIFLHAEQGFGDNIQFLRFVPPVAAMAQSVVLHLAQGLETLVTPALPANCKLLPAGSPLPVTDFHLPLMSLPSVLGTREQDISMPAPYLRADPAAAAAWRARLGPDGLKVGIAWSGNPTHSNDRNRSMALATLRAIAVEGCRFFTVQPHVRDVDREPLRAWQEAQDIGSELRDFAQTAALLEALDLVVTVDTSIAHLAGALGRPVWLLLPYVPDWRWLLDRADSPWYPTARVYRQRVRGDWFEVLARVRADLAAMLRP